MSLSLKQAFGRFSALVDNVRWQVSAIATDGAVVIACWSHLFDRSMTYRDRLSSWTGNTYGENRLRHHLELAHKNSLPIRLIMVTTQNPHALDDVTDASVIDKSFAVRDDLVGAVTAFDGDKFEIAFSPAR
jgi:hypothetical protein